MPFLVMVGIFEGCVDVFGKTCRRERGTAGVVTMGCTCPFNSIRASLVRETIDDVHSRIGFPKACCWLKTPVIPQ